MKLFKDNSPHAALSKGVLWLMYIGSAAISGLWFAQKMPGLFMNPTVYPLVAPLTSAVFGVAAMELAVLAWNYQVKQAALSQGQYWVAWMGLITALSMSVLTSFAAVMAFVGNGNDAAGNFIVTFVTSNGMAYYIGLQIILVAMFTFLFDESKDEASRKKAAGNQQRKPQQQQQIAPPVTVQQAATPRPTQAQQPQRRNQP